MTTQHQPVWVTTRTTHADTGGSALSTRTHEVCAADGQEWPCTQAR